MSDELPEGWTRTPLADLTAPGAPICYGVLKPGIKSTSGVPMLRVKDVRDGLVDESDILRIAHDLDREFARSRLSAGDVVVSVQGSVGRVATVPAHLANANISRTLARVRPLHPDLCPWIAFGLRSPEVQRAMTSRVGGTTRDSLNIRDLREIELQVAPLPEQHRIVAKVEALLDQVNRAKARLDRVPPILKRFRQAVLAAACSGKLTEEWRHQHPIVTTAESALRSAAEERLQAWLAGGSSRKPSNYKSPPAISAEATANLPDSWGATTGRAMFLWSSGSFLPKSKMSTGTVPVFGGNGISGYHNEVLATRPTIVVGRVGALCGNVHLTAGPAWITDNAIYAAWIASVIDPEYARMVLAARNLNANAGGSGQPFVSQELLDDQVLPFPPADEQREIVTRVQRFFEAADAIENRIVRAASLADKLPQTILSKAFSGELVPTEADLARAEGRDYETAAQLLGRIKAGGAGATNGGRLRKRREAPPTRRSSRSPSRTAQLVAEEP